MKEVMEGFTKPYKDFTEKKMADFSKVANDSAYYLLGVAMEASKGGGWKGALFIWPFALSFLIIIFLLVGTVITG